VRRVALAGGDWVDLADRLNHAQYRRVKRAANAPEPDVTTIETESVAALALNWSVRDVNGRELPFPGAAVDGVPAEALDAWPYEHVAEAFSVAADLIRGVPDPNATAASSDSSQEAPS
jgi:hypothetical protein